MTPRRRATVLRHIEFLRLSDKRILLIIVTPDGDVQNRILLTDRTYSPSELIEAANFINQNFAGLTFDEVKEPPARRAEAAARRHDPAAHQGGGSGQRSGDASRRKTTCSPASTTCCTCRTCRPTWPACGACSTCSSNAPRCCSCWRWAARRKGVQIYIGGESGLVPLDECSVVTAPYEVEGEVLGTVGVIGPTRMAYERVIPIVEITAKLLSMAMAQRVRALE